MTRQPDENAAVGGHPSHCLHPHPSDPGSFCCCGCWKRAVSLPGLTVGSMFGLPCISRGTAFGRVWRHFTEDWMLRRRAPMFASSVEVDE